MVKKYSFTLINFITVIVTLCTGLIFAAIAAGCVEPESNPAPDGGRTETIVEPDTLKTGLRKYEFRTTWICTVGNYDFKRVSSESGFKEQFTHFLDVHERYNMNAVIFQVSPVLDAFWPSEHRPWSRYLMNVNRQGMGPSGWSIDPLEWMVEETHKRNMEYHAWFNPYRVTSAYSSVNGKNAATLDGMTNAQVLQEFVQDSSSIKLDAKNFAVEHPGLVYRYDRTFYLDAGYPEARQHVIDTVMEVAAKYDVDAIHFDDFFYPYGASAVTFDQESFNEHGLGKPNPAGGVYNNTEVHRKEWRRQNNNKLIQGIKDALTEYNGQNKKAVQFGISPFARIQTAYSAEVFIDLKKWVNESMVDYLLPQIYWDIELINPIEASYSRLAAEWDLLHALSESATPVHLYVGHANYKLDDDPSAGWKMPNQIVRQLEINEKSHSIVGSSFFRFENLDYTLVTSGIRKESNDLIRDHWKSFTPIVPAKNWLMPVPPNAPVNVQREAQTGKIKWADTAANNSRYYAVYRVTSSTEGSGDPARVLADPTKIIYKVWRNGNAYEFEDLGVEDPPQYTYYVVAYNNAHVESAAARAVVTGPED